MNFTRNTLTLAVGALVLPVVASSAHAATSFIANSFYDQQHPHSRYGYIEWAEMVKELSNGELQPEVYTGTVLLAPRANLQGIQDNVVQVAHHAAIYTPSEMPVANAVQELGFNYDDPLIGILAVTDFSLNNPTQLAEWEELDIVYLGAYNTPSYVLFCREPVRNLEELRGKRIRTAGSTVSAWVEQAGGTPVNVPSSEMYSGLDRGSLDCASNAANDLIDRSLWEVAEHTTLLPTGMYWSGPQWGFNSGFWASLNDEERNVFKEATAKAMTRMIVQYLGASEAALEEAASHGNNIYEPEDDLMASVEAFRDEALANVYDKARDEYGVEDPEALIDDFIATYEKWDALISEVDREDEEALAELAMEEIYNKLPADYGIY
ncbi:C4-dicarboxylate TRAP transporter substrate-binding protein [Halomonas sp. IOP_14]|jgi:TRAP-type C4-dicarboxylate transport system substrate-binding protein|uniref:Extracellular solute-binding protein, family 7, bacteria n=1 Tax=Vreelandella titanicae BH1 TaxID=1204738 RepID=L9U747_9GAMM|nr:MULTISPECIES: C4-dicarboxylate TRAP transporter substrate-binding protein [Halomonas]ELY20441.1 Extracellular solute-binding protein, family 7, bacteria [Halomonas titanicae BH1]MCD1585041.1 C4-dicarboxylate TRAP transporter substrate-binding protein [Halomonas sp. IOP_14]NVE92750.1 C4-dicarboxylate TRAP transporter substrate-binding protein [Halomonas titanicae]|tara:strand:- start:471 stop:1607 length:1137 start_codon:yes stop_codon:yes gene_type:complete